jgi:cobalt/nickel transport protein
MKMNLLLLSGVLLLTVIPFLKTLTFKEDQASFTGADGQAEEVIAQIDADYTPWFKPFWEPPGSEIESLLFGLQAAIGAGLIGYCLGFYRSRLSAGRRSAGIETRKP